MPLGGLKSSFPKYVGDTGFVSLAGRWAKLEGWGAHFSPATPGVHVINRSKCLRDNFSLTFAKADKLMFVHENTQFVNNDLC